jgi:formate dehydrogenase subunit delta
MDTHNLVTMANQIGAFFETQAAGHAPDAIAEHLRRFWDPRMRKAILAHLEAGGEGLTPAAAQAVQQLRG